MPESAQNITPDLNNGDNNDDHDHDHDHENDKGKYNDNNSKDNDKDKSKDNIRLAKKHSAKNDFYATVLDDTVNQSTYVRLQRGETVDLYTL